MTTLTEVFPCFFLSCKANAGEKTAKTGHGPHSSYFLCCSMYFLCCSMYSLFCDVLCIVCVYMCTVLLPPGGYPIAVNKYIISYHILAYEVKGKCIPCRTLHTVWVWQWCTAPLFGDTWKWAVSFTYRSISLGDRTTCAHWAEDFLWPGVATHGKLNP